MEPSDILFHLTLASLVVLVVLWNAVGHKR
jgi:hypothetical protein